MLPLIYSYDSLFKKHTDFLQVYCNMHKDSKKKYLLSDFKLKIAFSFENSNFTKVLKYDVTLTVVIFLFPKLCLN